MARVKFLFDSYGTEKTEYITDCIKRDAEEKRRAFWLVPEQNALECERVVATVNAQLYVEVLNFTRLCDKAFRLWGGIKTNYIDASAKNLVMYQALCTARRDNRLSEYNKIAEGHERGCVALFLDAVSELKSYAIKPAMLTSISEKIDDERLKARTNDLAIIYTIYNDILKASYSDPYDALEELAVKLDEADVSTEKSFFDGANVYISSFYGFTGAQMKVIEKIITQASEVTFALDVSEADFGKIQYDKLTMTAKRLRALCEVHGIMPEKIKLDTDSFHKSDAIIHLVKNIWRLNAPSIDSCEGVSLMRPRDEFEECELVASKIRELVMNGARYSEIAIIVRNTDTYRGIIDYALKKYGINFFISASTDATSRPLIKMLYSAINASSYWSVRDVATFMRSRYAGVSPKDADLLEDYMYRWGIYGSRFESEWKNNPDGYSTEPMSEEQRSRLERINRTRAYVCEKISVLKSAFNSVGGATRGARAEDICKAVYKFLTEINVKKSLFEEFCATKDRNEKLQISQLYSAVLDSLNTVCKIIPDEILDQESFLCALSYSLDGVELGALPTGEDNVTVGQADSLRASGIKHAFVLGVTEGSFPASVGAVPFFSDEDKKALEEAFEHSTFRGATLSESSKTRYDSELLMFKNSIAFPSHTLVVSAPLSDIRGTKKEPSLAFERILKLLPSLKSGGDRKSQIFTYSKRVRVIKAAQIESLEQYKSRYAKGLAFSLTPEAKLCKSVASRIYTKSIGAEFLSGSSLASVTVRHLLGSDSDKNGSHYDDVSNENLKISPDLAKADGILCHEDENGEKRLKLSQSQIELFVGCNFQYYCDRVLGLRDSEVISFGSAQVGDLAHEIFEKFLIDAEIDKGKRLSDVSEEQKNALINTITDDYLKRLCPDGKPEARLVHLFERLKSNIIYYINDLAAELDQSDFKPAFFELDFSDKKNGCPPLEFKTKSGVTVFMTGIADRVDVFAPTEAISSDEENGEGDDGNNALYLRVVDYKTGSKSFKMSEFENGRQIQLPLYLATLCRPDTEFAKRLLKKHGKDKIKPAGVMYFPMEIGKSKVEGLCDSIDSVKASELEKNALLRKRNGLFVGNIDLLLAQDKTFGKKPTRFLPFKTSKNSHLFLDEKTFMSTVNKTLEDTIYNITDKLLSGSACAQPLNGDTENICKYCTRLAVCRKRRKI